MALDKATKVQPNHYTLAPSSEQIEHVRQCPARHAVFTGDEIDNLNERIGRDDWVVGADLTGRPTMIGGGEATRAGEPWHNPNHEFVVFEGHRLRRASDVLDDGNGIAYNDGGWHDAGLEVWAAWRRFVEARNPLDQAQTMNALHEAMTNLGTWLPGYDYGSGEVTDPRDVD